MSFLEKIETELRGKPARLKMTDSDGDTFDMKFPNNYQMRQVEKRIKARGFEYEIIHKRTEWFKQLARLWWIIGTIQFAYDIITSNTATPLYRGFLLLVFAFYVYTFKQYVITLDY